MPVGLNQMEAERSAVTYAKEVMKWPREAYRLEVKGLTKDGSAVRIWIIYLDDERNPKPGGGKSIELQLAITDYRVVKVLGLQ